MLSAITGVSVLLGGLLLLTYLGTVAFFWRQESAWVARAKGKLEGALLDHERNPRLYSPDVVRDAQDYYAQTILDRRDAWAWPAVALWTVRDSRQEKRQALAGYRERTEERRRAEITKRYEAALKDYEKMKKEK